MSASTESWVEYAEIVAGWDEVVAAAKGANKDAVAAAFRERWAARLRHPSWEAKRQDFLWYTNSHCEHCGHSFPSAELQLHHLNYDTLWYENNSDLELLCRGCHRVADEERARNEMRQKRLTWDRETRARRYMELANRWSGQEDWPVTYDAALDHIDQLDSGGS